MSDDGSLTLTILRLPFFRTFTNVRSGAVVPVTLAQLPSCVGVNVCGAAPSYPAGTLVSVIVYCVPSSRLSMQKSAGWPLAGDIWLTGGVAALAGLTLNSAPARSAPLSSVFLTTARPQLVRVIGCGAM